ncbi:antibiotic biosynthesis monooxygenase [Roseomonas sp. PWR1]|uniref:Antibiotic biosynthesis monooxygenase n=1 Tax=Roseomonas nitratireducens TaxID=2820810 RepID=A0ABS4AV08_9PROT|nr:antibiotic biosynthesis monooxygenase family protein [Neoroseomonas nitratireducens]MBP0465198.1 antibiotic biosynthesis monooxygenase [Neoroseomonas nitratireducens]
MIRLASLAPAGMLASMPAMAQPVTLINVFEVPEGKLPEAITYWEASRAFLATQPGFIRTRLHQPIAPNARFQLINVAEWESPQAFQPASARMQQEVSGSAT